MDQAKPFDVTTVGDKRTLWVESSRVAECVDFCRSQGIRAIGINAFRGYFASDLHFVANFPEVEEVDVVFPAGTRYDVNPLSMLPRLKRLRLSDPVALDLSKFMALEAFNGVWDRGLRLDGCRALRELTIGKYAARSGSLGELPTVASLESLRIVDSRVGSLRGLERFRGLRALELALLPRVESLEGLDALEALESLRCITCRKLRDYDAIRTLSQLRTLWLVECGTMRSLSFLDGIRALQEFRFVFTKVQDGDLRPVLGINRVAFTPSRSYSHQPPEVPGFERPLLG